MINRRQFIAATAVAFAPLGVSESNKVQPPWEPDGVGSLARIGVLTPDDDPVPESEMRAMAPEGISIHASRVLWNGDPGSFAAGVTEFGFSEADLQRISRENALELLPGLRPSAAHGRSPRVLELRDPATNWGSDYRGSVLGVQRCTTIKSETESR